MKMLAIFPILVTLLWNVVNCALKAASKLYSEAICTLLHGHRPETLKPGMSFHVAVPRLIWGLGYAMRESLPTNMRMPGQSPLPALHGHFPGREEMTARLSLSSPLPGSP